MSYVIPTNELSLADRKAYIAAAVESGIKRALSLGVAADRSELVVREALPRTDMGAAATTGWVDEEYVTNTIAGTPAWISAFSNGALAGSAQQVGRNQVLVFYKFADTESTPVVTAVRFRVGPTGSTTKAVFFIQLPTEAKLEPDVYFTEPIIYDPLDWLYIEVYCTGNDDNRESIPFGCFAIERTGGIVS